MHKKLNIKVNFLYNILYQLLLIILPLITAPYLSRVLGAGQLGQYSYTYSVANYFVLFSMLGVNNYGNRCIARVRGDRTQMSSEFWSVYSFQIIIAALITLLYVSYAVELSGDVILALVWLPYVLSAGLDVNWLFFGLEEFRITVTRNFIVKLTAFVLTLFLVRGNYALLIYCALISSSFLVSVILLWPFVKRFVDWKRPSAREILRHIKPNLILFIPVIAVSLYTILDKVMLGWLSSFVENGYFENAYKVATMPMAVITALGMVMLPRVANLMAEGKNEKAHRYLGISIWAVMAMSYALSFGVIGIAPILVSVLFGDGFGPSELAMCVIVADMPFMAWANVLRTQLLIPEGRDSEYVISVMIGALVNIAINLVLITRFGALGAAIGTFWAEVAVCLIQAWSVRGELPQISWFAKSLPFAAIGLAMCTVVRLMGEVMGTSAFTLLVQIMVGGAIYSLLSLAWCVVTHDKNYKTVVEPILIRLFMGRYRSKC